MTNTNRTRCSSETKHCECSYLYVHVRFGSDVYLYGLNRMRNVPIEKEMKQPTTATENAVDVVALASNRTNELYLDNTKINFNITTDVLRGGGEMGEYELLFFLGWAKC